MSTELEQVARHLAVVQEQLVALEQEREQLLRELIRSVRMAPAPERLRLAPAPCPEHGCVLREHPAGVPHHPAPPERAVSGWVSEAAGLEHTDPRMMIPESRLRQSRAVRDLGGVTTHLSGQPLSHLSQPVPCQGIPVCGRELKHQHFADGSVVTEDWSAK